ncbi:hypothetical protein SCLCIDRAFT_1224188 [Scleroderma citrinum Foug A]|uniref:Uncharacterized protein n=1 Tax=Scleroderma citrinum Foug A TaxID=1036808 RepID=A0A0C3CT19_9AGAM|nr:hypothetical protein SCLCIDRAFT_1224188 [Scleroderma citrinum Foug A]
MLSKRSRFGVPERVVSATVVRVTFMYRNSHSPSPLLFPEPLSVSNAASSRCPVFVSVSNLSLLY